jgi:hypothetical protein
MTNYNWIGGSGNWDNAKDWNPNGVPTDFDTVNIQTPGITVTVEAGLSAQAYALTTVGSGFDIVGNLYTVHLATFAGAYTQSAGVFTAGGLGAIFNSTFDQTGGSILLHGGSLQLNDGGDLSGSFGGTGALDILGGNVYAAATFKCSLGSIVIGQSARVGFLGDFAYSHNFSVIGGVLDMFGHKLSLSGTDVFSGTVGNGLIQVGGTLTLGTTSYNTTLDNGLTLSVVSNGLVVATNNVAMGTQDAGAKINVAKTSHFDINGNWTFSDPSQVGSITSAGVFAKTGGGKQAVIDTSFTSTGTLEALIGELQLNGLVNSISGTVSGSGTLGIAGGQTTIAPKVALSVKTVHQEGGVLEFNAAQTYGGVWNMSGGVLDLNTNTANLTLTGVSSFDGGVITSYGATLTLNGASEISNVVIGGPTLINVNSTLDQVGSIYFGQSSNPTVDIAAKASWLLQGDGEIIGLYGLVNNAGTFGTPNGSGDTYVQTELSSTGTVESYSTLTLAGTSILGGTLLGSGIIDLAAATTLDAGLSIQVAALDVSALTTLGGNLSDAGAFTQASGTIDLSGSSLALTGTTSLDAGTLTDNGVLSTAGQTTVGYYYVTDGAELLISGVADQVGALTLDTGAGAGTLSVAAGGYYTVQDDLVIAYGGQAPGSVDIAGQLAESGTGTAFIYALVNLASTGTLVANDRQLNLQGGGDLSGAISGPGEISLGSGLFDLGSGLTITSPRFDLSAGTTLALTAPESYVGDFSAESAILELNAALSLNGTQTFNANTYLENGSLHTSGNTTLAGINVIDNATLTIGGNAIQLSTSYVGDPQGKASTSDLNVLSGGTLTLSYNTSIYDDGTLTVGGSLATTGAGTDQIGTAIVDTGVITANLGTLQILGSVSASSTGIFSIAKGALLDFAQGATIGLKTGVSFGGVGFLKIDDLKTFNATIEQFSTGDAIQISGLATTATGTFASSADKVLVISDGTNTIDLTFSTAQTLSSLSFTSTSTGVFELVHH